MPKKVMRRIPTVRAAGAMEYFAYPLRPWGQLHASPWSLAIALQVDARLEMASGAEEAPA